VCALPKISPRRLLCECRCFWLSIVLGLATSDFSLDALLKSHDELLDRPHFTAWFVLLEDAPRVSQRAGGVAPRPPPPRQRVTPDVASGAPKVQPVPLPPPSPPPPPPAPVASASPPSSPSSSTSSPLYNLFCQDQDFFCQKPFIVVFVFVVVGGGGGGGVGGRAPSRARHAPHLRRGGAAVQVGYSALGPQLVTARFQPLNLPSEKLKPIK
jgi:hypothetical protein